MSVLKRYDLRRKDLLWTVRDSYAGANLTDAADVVAMKKILARNMLIIVVTVTVMSIGFWLAR